MLNKLTPEQEARFPEFRKKWTDVGLSVEPTNREEAERGVDLAYAAAGLPPPATKVWFKSHYAGAKEACRVLKVDSMPQAIYGQQEAGWLGFYDFFDSCGIKSEDLAGLMTVAKNAGWWWALDTVAIMTDRPVEIHLDFEGRLHNQFGMSIKYGDGYGLYTWHGVGVPAEWITNPEKISPQTALTWPNIEQRRCAAEIVGWKKILAELSPTVIDTDVDPMIGQLLEVDLPDSPKTRFLRVTCGTQREFCLPVPPEMKTALQANSWSYGVDDAVGIEQFRNYAVRT